MLGVAGAALSLLPSQYYSDWTGNGVDRSGRTSLPLHASARPIYVSPALGSDASVAPWNSGTPVATVAVGMAAIRNGAGDHLLLSDDELHPQVIPTVNDKRGFSTAYPTVIQSYRRADPSNQTLWGVNLASVATAAAAGAVLASQSRGQWPGQPAGGSFDGPINGPVVFRGLKFSPPQQTLPLSSSSQTYQIGFSGGVSHLLIENCCILHAQMAISTGAPAVGYVLRKVALAYYSAAFYASWSNAVGPTMWTIEDCIAHHGGWLRGGARDAIKYGATENANTVDHNFYLGEGFHGGTNGAALGAGPVLFRRNVSSHASSHGLQARSGGVIADNLFIRNPLNCYVGYGSSASQQVQGGVDAQVLRNFVLGGQDITPIGQRGVAFSAGNTRSSSRFRGNIVAKLRGPGQGGTTYGTPATYNNSTNSNPQFPTAVHSRDDLQYDWLRQQAWVLNTMGAGYDLSLSTLDAAHGYHDSPTAGTLVDSAGITFLDTSRDLLTYMATLGWAPVGGTYVEQEAQALDYIIANWHDQAAQRRFLASAIRPYLARGFNR